MHSSMLGPNFVHGPLTKRPNGVLVAEKLQVFNMGFVIWARGCETSIVSIQVEERILQYLFLWRFSEFSNILAFGFYIYLESTALVSQCVLFRMDVTPVLGARFILVHYSN
jgi:hypothetical protein